MRANYDFSHGVRGKHYKKFKAGHNLIAIDPDLVKMFPDSQSVNAALRALATLAKKAKAAVL